MLISESFLKPSLPSPQYALPGFVLIRNVRIDKGGGGAAVYLRTDISYTVVCASDSEYSEPAEYLLLGLSVNHSKVLLSMFYSPKLTIDYFESFDKILSDLCPICDHVILICDFNTCLINNDSRSSKILYLYVLWAPAAI